MEKVDHLFDARIFEAFSLGFERFGDVNDDILHPFMGLFRAADEEEFFSLGDAFVTILVIESNPNQADEFGLILFFF